MPGLEGSRTGGEPGADSDDAPVEDRGGRSDGASEDWSRRTWREARSRDRARAAEVYMLLDEYCLPGRVTRLLLLEWGR